MTTPQRINRRPRGGLRLKWQLVEVSKHRLPKVLTTGTLTKVQQLATRYRREVWRLAEYHVEPIPEDKQPEDNPGLPSE